MTTIYKVHIGGNCWRRFPTLAAASAFCGEIFKRTGLILTIVQEAA